MTGRFASALAVAAGIVTAAMPVSLVSAQSPAVEVHLLDVPYLPQSESLCGGAAIAMVMRYWGADNIYAETFADLIDPAADGIHGSDLLKALRSRGWDARSFRGDIDEVRAKLNARQPVVALIQDRPARFHYVVIVGWAAGRIIVHDPARTPFRVLDEKSFQESWKASEYWALIASPPPSIAADTTSATRPAAGTKPIARHDAPCSDLVKEGVRLATADDTDGARSLFELAAASCPASADPWREMAGLHALAAEWPAAAADAQQALARDSSDALAARILATSLYLTDDTDGALDAWNRVGEPNIDLINITGLDRTRYSVAARAMALEPRTQLTRGNLTAARRRLSELPSAQATRIAMRPGESGRVRVDAAVMERPLFPRSAVALGAIGLRAMSDRETVVTIASPSGSGETWSASWRWWERRPKVALDFESPAPFGGVWGVSFFDERQSYGVTGGVSEESRRRAEFHVSDWTLSGFRWEGAVAMDRFDDTDDASGNRAIAASGSLQRRVLDDRAFVEARAGLWGGQLASWTFAVGAEWRSTPHNEGAVLIARGVDAVAAPDAPLALWPGAGTGQGRDGLLRAHPLIDDGVIRDGVFGRHVVDGSFEWRRWVQPSRKPVRIAPALFVDVARAYRGLDSSNEQCQVDVGGGFRLAVPGSGVLRIDVAHGLRDGRTAVSMGWGR